MLVFCLIVIESLTYKLSSYPQLWVMHDCGEKCLIGHLLRFDPIYQLFSKRCIYYEVANVPVKLKITKRTKMNIWKRRPLSNVLFGLRGPYTTRKYIPLKILYIF